MVNEIDLINKLEKGRFDRNQAETQVKTMTEYSNSNLATKDDVTDIRYLLKDLKSEISNQFKGVDQRFKEVDNRFKEIDLRFGEVDLWFEKLEQQISNLAKDLMFSVASVIVGCFVVIGVIVGLIANSSA